MSLSKSPKWDNIRADNELFCDPLSPDTHVTNPNGIFCSKNILLNGDKYVRAINGIVICFFATSNIDNDNSMHSFRSYSFSVNLYLSKLISDMSTLILLDAPIAPPWCKYTSFPSIFLNPVCSNIVSFGISSAILNVASHNNSLFRFLGDNTLTFKSHLGLLIHFALSISP